MPVPRAVGVYWMVSVQLAEAPVPESLQLEGVKVPGPSLRKLNVPVGVVGPNEVISVTVTTQEVEL